ncbi:MAG: cupin domain-containing protein [Acidimicrobiia bacterium]
MADPTFDLARFPVHLGSGATVVPLEEFDGTPEWYARYGARFAADGDEGRLVSIHTFSESWDSWEMHPRGEELVLCVAGSVTLHQELDGATTTVTLATGEAVINPRGAWHTADVTGPCTAVFVTAGSGTEVRPR